jgi:exopolyphosphatase/pppGpp-phosphohydrolase
LADRRIRSAVGNDSALVAQTRRELEAKVRVIDGKAEAVPAAGEQ